MKIQIWRWKKVRGAEYHALALGRRRNVHGQGQQRETQREGAWKQIQMLEDSSR